MYQNYRCINSKLFQKIWKRELSGSLNYLVSGYWKLNLALWTHWYLGCGLTGFWIVANSQIYAPLYRAKWSPMRSSNRKVFYWKISRMISNKCETNKIPMRISVNFPETNRRLPIKNLYWDLLKKINETISHL